MQICDCRQQVVAVWLAGIFKLLINSEHRLLSYAFQQRIGKQSHTHVAQSCIENDHIMHTWNVGVQLTFWGYIIRSTSDQQVYKVTNNRAFHMPISFLWYWKPERVIQFTYCSNLLSNLGTVIWIVIDSLNFFL